jgi:hypothetical protein
MKSNQKNRVRLSVEALEHRDAPASLTISHPGFEARAVRSAAAHSHDRPFHAEDSGTAVIIGDFGPGTIINAIASGQATHLGAFTLHDSSTVVGAEGAVRYIEGEADLEADNGDHLYASFTGTVDLATFTATVNFEWTGGTGRFADATGATVWQVSLNADLTYTAVATGDINY